MCMARLSSVLCSPRRSVSQSALALQHKLIIKTIRPQVMAMGSAIITHLAFWLWYMLHETQKRGVAPCGIDLRSPNTK